MITRFPMCFLFLAIGLAAPILAPPLHASEAQPAPAPVPAAKRKPNIIVLLADDLGVGDLSSYSPVSKIKTPRLDALASQGVRFTDAHSPSSVCTPTRYGLMTGRYAWRSRLKSGVLGGYSPRLIEPGRETLASMLAKQGYATGHVGKWHLGWTWPKAQGEPFGDNIQGFADDPKSPKDKGNRDRLWSVKWDQPITDGPRAVGFDYHFGISASLDMPPFVYIENDRVVSPPTTVKKWLRHGPAAADFEAVNVLPDLTRKAIAWIEACAKSDKPFFLYLAYASPHTPIVPTPEFEGKSGLNPYGDFVIQTDHDVGALLDALDRLNLTKDTLVVFTADNGCSPAANWEELSRKGHTPSGPFRGHKADAYEGGHRVPFILRWPGRAPAGAVSDETLCLTDLYASFASIVGVKPAEDAAEDSVDMTTAFEGRKLEAPLREATVHHSISGFFAIRQGPWKLIFARGSGGWSPPREPEAAKQGLPPIQLYHLGNDPGERKNLQADHPDIVQRLTKLLQSYVDQGRSTPGAAQKNHRQVEFK